MYAVQRKTGGDGENLLKMAEKKAAQAEGQINRLQLEIERSTDPDEKKQLREEKNLWMKLLLTRKTEGKNGDRFGMSVLIPLSVHEYVS